MEDCEVGEDQPTSGRGLEFSSFRENRKEVTHAQSLQPAGTTGSNTISKLYMSSGEGVSLNPIFASPLFLAGVRRGSGLGLLVLDASAHSLSLSLSQAGQSTQAERWVGHSGILVSVCCHWRAVSTACGQSAINHQHRRRE
jgi:hypothetical protein